MYGEVIVRGGVVGDSYVCMSSACFLTHVGRALVSTK